MKLWKCWNCDDDRGLRGRDFENASGVCPSCKLDHANPEHRDLVVRRVCIHFDPPHGQIRGRGVGKRACDGQPVQVPGGVTDPGFASTRAPDAVNCPACRETGVWKKAADAAGVPRVPDEADVVIPPEPEASPKAAKKGGR